MISEQVLLDTGVWVAPPPNHDTYHDWAVEQWKQIKPPVFTCEAVVSETCFLLKRPYLIDAVFEMMTVEAVEVNFDLRIEVESIRDLMQRYESVPISVADACLVRMSELIPNNVVLTLDSDFQIYRRFKKDIISTIQPKLF